METLNNNVPFLEQREKINTNFTATQSHIDAIDNPHFVTKAQVGLSNVDDTADVNKPISTPVQTALDGKAVSPDDFTVTGAEVLRTMDFTDMGALTLSQQIQKITSVLATLIADLKNQ